jgi:hypothetical protein
MLWDKRMPALSPVVVVFLGLGTAYALLFHLWRGRSLPHLLFFWLVSILGFGMGYWVATLWASHPLVLVGIPVLEASIGSLVLLGFANRFTI